MQMWHVQWQEDQVLRHVFRTHRINAHWIYQVVREQPIDLGACESRLMASDICTKCFGTTDKWTQVMKMIGHLSRNDVLRSFNQGSRLFPTDLKQEDVDIQMDKPTEGEDVSTKSNGSDLISVERIQLAGGIVTPTFKPTRQPNRLLLEWCCSDTSFSVCHLMSQGLVQW